MQKMKRLTTQKRQMKRDNFADTCSTFINGVISFFIILLVLVFPLVCDKWYLKILKLKYQVYWVCVIAMLVLCFVLSLIMLIVDIIENKGEHTKIFFSSLLPSNWKKSFNIPDITALVFWAILVISTIQSDYVYESFWGNEGRFSGLFLLSLYISSYFLISRLWHVKNWILWMFLFSGMIICIIGITDYFQLDILGFRSGEIIIDPSMTTLYTSTVGNINTYTAYVALIMGFSGTMFATEKRRCHLIGFYICMIVSFIAIILGCSDNAYLSLAALFVFAPIRLFNCRLGIKRYLIMIASFFSVVQFIDWINQKFADTVIGLDSLFQVIVNFKWLLPITVIMWLLVAGIYYYDKKTGKDALELDKRPVKIWLFFMAAAMLVICYAFYDVNFGGHAERYGSIGYYLEFKDSWGTNRGYIWRKTVELYRNFNPMHKLFGYGLDTFGILTLNEINSEMREVTSQVFENAHNEYLQYLITIGITGLIAYIVFIGSALTRMYKYLETNHYIVGCIFAVVCYVTQAVVNISLPIATPMMWLLLSIGMAGCKKG